MKLPVKYKCQKLLSRLNHHTSSVQIKNYQISYNHALVSPDIRKSSWKYLSIHRYTDYTYLFFNRHLVYPLLNLLWCASFSHVSCEPMAKAWHSCPLLVSGWWKEYFTQNALLCSRLTHLWAGIAKVAPLLLTLTYNSAYAHFIVILTPWRR